MPLREKGAYVEWVEGGFIVRDGKGRQFVYSQVDNPRGGGLATKMSLEWELSDGGTFKPFSLTVTENEGDEIRAFLGIQALWPKMSNRSGVSLDYEDNMWRRRSGIWFDGHGNLERLPMEVRDDVPVSNRFEYCVPVNLDETLPLWLTKLENGDFSMPVIVPARTVMVDGFEWRAPYEESGSTFFPENTRRLTNLLDNDDVSREQWGKIYHKVILIGTAMRVRFSQERI